MQFIQVGNHTFKVSEVVYFYHRWLGQFGEFRFILKGDKSQFVKTYSKDEYDQTVNYLNEQIKELNRCQ